MSTFLYKFYFRDSQKDSSYKGGLVFVSNGDISFFFEKLANVLGLAGRKRKFISTFRKVFFLVRKTYNMDVKDFFRDILSKFVVFIGIKIVRKRSVMVKELCFLKHDKAFGLFCRWFKFALSLRSERNLEDKIFKEFVDLSLGKGSTFRKRQEHISKILEIKKQLYL